MGMPKTKIIYCVTKSAFGGAGRYVLDLATSLPRDNFDIAVAFGGRGILKEKLENAGIRTITLEALERDINISNDFEVYKKLLLIFNVEKPDVIHLNSSKIGGLGALAGRMAGVKNIVFTAHGWPFNENRNIFSKVAIWLLSWLTALLSTKIIVVDEYDLRQAEKFPFCKDKIFLIHNGISDFELLKREEARKAIIGRIGKDPFKNKICIGTIAELHKNKGLKYGIEAIGRLPDKELEKIIYMIIGEGEDREELTSLIAELKLKEKVFLLGFMDDAKKYLNAFDIFMFPSLKEGLPYALLEAGYAGLPIITTRVGGIPDIIGDIKSQFLVESKRSLELSRALSEIINNKKVRDALSKKTKENVAVKFNLEKMTENTIKIYNIR